MSDAALALRWLVALEVIGWGLYPLLYRATPGLRDRGLTVARPCGLLLLVYPVWFGAALRLPLFTTPVLVGVGVALIGAAWGLALRRPVSDTPPGDRLPDFLRASWRYVILSEVIFVAAFCFYLWLRGYNPEILGTEKPMEIGFLSAATRQEALPPRDPWLSGYGINYYYLGYILVAALAKLAAIPATTAFNLGLATIFAMVVLGGTGVTANLLAARANGGPSPRAATLLAGLLGGYLLAFAGNMYAARDLLARGGAAVDTWWWGGLGWKSSRVVIDSGFPEKYFGPGFGPSETINEFPFFSFILGDLHAHVLALPFTLLALALALDIFLAPPDLGGAAGRGLWKSLPSRAALARLGLAALTIGGLYALNSWDLPTYAAIYLAALATPLLLARHTIARREWAVAGGFVVACVALYAPFHARFTSLVGGEPFQLPEPLASVPLIPAISKLLGVVIWGKTPADQFFTVYLLPWSVGLLFLAWRWREGHKVAATRNWTTPIFAVLALALGATLLQMPVFLFAGALLLLAGAILRQHWELGTADEAHRDADLFAIVLIGAAFALVLVTEVFFVHDVFGNRMNTIFKVYYQAWTLLAVAGGYAIVRLWPRWPAPRLDLWRIPATAAITLLLLASVAYPIVSSRSRTDGFKVRTGLDGLDFVGRSEPGELAGIRWVQEHVPAGAVIAEAPGCSYGEFLGLPHDRVSAFAGVSTPLGWGGHESQWRGGSPALLAQLGPRGDDINRLYSTQDVAEARAILDRYGIGWVYVGIFERTGYTAGGFGSDCRAGGGYPASGLAKFDTLMERVFGSDDGAVAIYRRR